MSSLSPSAGSKRKAPADQQPEDPAAVTAAVISVPENPRAAAAESADANNKKPKHAAAVNAAIEHLVCALTHDLPIDPVTAEDGFVYEKREIEAWIRTKRKVTSPRTNQAMGRKLLPAVQVRSTIQDLVESGAVGGDLAKGWKKGMKRKKKVEDTTKKAEGGDVNAMHSLMIWYRKGINGLSKNVSQSNYWAEQSSNLKNPVGMDIWGVHLATDARSNVKTRAHGIALLSSAAGMGSDLSCYSLAELYRDGRHITKSEKEAMYWYKKATDGSCQLKHLSRQCLNEAMDQLSELREQLGQQE